MRTTLTFESSTAEKLNLLIRIAAEMGIKILRGKKEIQTYSEDDALSIASEPSLSEAWNSPEDERWDDLYKKK